MNYKPIFLEKLKELMVESPDLTLGDIIYSILRKPMLKETPEDANIIWLRDVSDFDFFNSVSRLIKEEKEHKI